MNYLIPNYIVRGGNDAMTLINQMLVDNVISDNDGDKVLLIFMYFWSNTTQSNTVNFTLEDMIINCGFVPRANKNGINDKFKIILDYLNKNNYFEPNNIDFMNIKPKEFIKVRVQYFNTDDKSNRIRYFILDDREIESIYSIANVDNNKLLLYFSALKSRIYINSSVEDTKPQVCYATVEDMAKDIQLSEDTLYLYNDILVDSGLIYKDKAPTFTRIDKNKRIYRESANTYTLTSISNYKEEVKNSIDIFISYMKESGWEVCEDTTLSKRQIAGSINKLISLQQQGKLSEENRIKLEELQEQQNVLTDSKKWDNKQLLEKNHGKLLSDIFLDMNLDKLAEKYEDIEYKLGLINDDLNLLVDWNYYKWIITEYNINEHGYYKNMVDKKIRENVSEEKPEGYTTQKPYFGQPNPMKVNIGRTPKSFTEDFADAMASDGISLSELNEKEVVIAEDVKKEQSFKEVELQNIETILRYYKINFNNLTEAEEKKAKELVGEYKRLKLEIGA